MKLTATLVFLLAAASYVFAMNRGEEAVLGQAQAAPLASYIIRASDLSDINQDNHPETGCPQLILTFSSTSPVLAGDTLEFAADPTHDIWGEIDGAPPCD